MKNIVYICSYMLEDIIKERNNSKVFSQAANNKIKSISNALNLNKCNVTIISNGWVNNKSFKIFNGFSSNLNNKVIYTKIIDAPILNLLSAIYYGYKKVVQLNKIQKIDYLIFYNFRPETAFIAYLANKILKVQIIVEYEDGYGELSNIKGIKRWIFNKTEEVIKKKLYGAILVTSKLIPKINCKSVIVRGMVNQNIIDLKSKDSIKSNKIPVLLYCGGLDHVRGINILLNSLKYCKSEFILNIIGRGECEKNVIECKDKRVKFLGYYNDYNDVVYQMIRANILINPQLESHPFGNASFPSKIFDYLSTENLIISSNVSDISEFSKNSISIYYNDNIEELAKLIDQNVILLNDFKLLNEKQNLLHNLILENTEKVKGEEIYKILLQ